MWRPQTYFALLAVLCWIVLWNNTIPALEFAHTSRWEVWITRLCLFSATGAAYFSLRTSLRSDRYHPLNFLILIFYVGYLSYSALIEFIPLKQLHYFYRHEAQENKNIHLFAGQALTGTAEEDRRKSAQVSFVLYGLHVAYKSEAGQMHFYTPTPEDLARREELVESGRKVEESLRNFEKAVVKHPSRVAKSVLLAGGIFLLFFGADILWIVFLRPWREL